MVSKEAKYKHIPEMVKTQAEKYGDKIYLHFLGKTLTYHELHDKASRLGKFLEEELNLPEKSHVGLLLPNGVEFILGFIGPMYARYTVIPYNTLLKADELEYQINNSDIVALITNPSFYKVLKPVLDKLTKVKHFIFTEPPEGVENPILFYDAIEKTSPGLPKGFANLQPDDIATMIYTSGTTGFPKGCMLSQKNYIRDIEMVLPRIGYSEDDTNLCVMPLFHVNGQVASVLSTIYAGATLVLDEMFKPRSFIPTLKKYKINSFSAVPAMYNFLNEMPEYKDGEDLSFLKACICGAAPMPVEVFNKFEKKFKGKIIEGYGLSEGTCVSSLNPLHGERKIGSIGIPIEDQDMAIWDDQGNELPDGEIGEIVIRGDNVMQGYYKNEEATKETIVNGWLRTGDMGYRDKDGFYFITGRKKEMIIRGGENIYPKEIEEALYEHPGVLECAVIGLPDKKYGEQVVAVIRAKEGYNLNAREMRQFLKKKIANYKMPAKYEFVMEFPKTSTGKIQKLKLRDELIGDQQSVKRIKETIRIPYRWAYGDSLSKFFTELKENGKIWGRRCSKCGKVYLPPKSYCGVCFADCEDWVELPDVGKLDSFTTVHMHFPGQPKEPPYIIGWVRLDGSHTNIYHILDCEDETGLYIGKKVKARWRPKEERKGTIYDIECFVPVEE
ncbi:MAG: long-chain fatty acid--CoA ligase [Candidatus Hydrogenedentota bacterium]|nr:MAG: long-chain fatty acid--CoA ligase [Candidatus Hydrogenedentota bacterium]